MPPTYLDLIILLCVGCLPLLVRWRWGLLASLATTVATIMALVALLAMVLAGSMVDHRCPECKSLEIEGMGVFVFVVILAALLVGQALAVMWSVALLAWRQTKDAAPSRPS